ncbi:MAG: APC family permease [Hyphomicrobium sp.]|uniref:APC family permease n=1 Tax=Hyphomicrobium sp. TaxID=82 RepID=UPI0039E478E5
MTTATTTQTAHFETVATRTGSGLKKNYLSFPEIAAQSIGTIAPSGTPGLVISVVFATAGNGTWLSYVFATIALLIVALQINVFATRVATPGALYVYAGRGLGPFAGVVSGWALLIGYVFTAAAVVNGTVYTTLSVLHAAGLTASDHALTFGIAIVAAIVAWWLAYRDIRLSTRTTLAIELATIVLILAVVVGYFLHRGGIVDEAQLHLEGVDFEKLRLGLVLAFFSFVGFESAAVLGAEAKEPHRLIPRSVIVSVVGVGLLFIVSAYALTSGFRGVEPPLSTAEAPLTTLANTFGGGAIGLLVSIGVALSFFACILGSINAAARVLYTLSNHGLFHGSAGSTHVSNSTPHIAVTLVALIALGLALAQSLSGWALLDGYGILGSIATYGFLVSYFLVSLGAPFYLRKRGELRWHHVLSSGIAIALLAVVLFGTVYPLPAWPYNILPYVFLALLGIGVAYFLFLRVAAPDRLVAVEADLLGTDPART